MRSPFVRLERLVRRHLADEDEATARLSQRLQAARVRGYLTAGELEAVCRWKSPRAIWQVRANTHHRIRRCTAAALATRDEARRLEALLELRGVSVAMASAALTLLHPRRYGVIDIRVWQLLHRVGAVQRNAEGVGLSAANWQEFLAVIRDLARRLSLTPRDVERALFDAHRAAQKGLLYRTARRTPRAGEVR
jgi:hypothetical protein